MNKKTSVLFVSLLLGVLLGMGTGFAQSETHKWKTLTTLKQYLWYDSSQLDTITSNQFSIWIIELHKPQIEIDGISGKINRTKTLYVVDSVRRKYGIEQVVYYDNANRELSNIKYETAILTDTYKYCFPILKNSFMNNLLAEFEKNQKSRK